MTINNHIQEPKAQWERHKLSLTVVVVVTVERWTIKHKIVITL